MECREVLDRLSAYLDDELDPLASREIATHLATCPSCAAEHARLARLREVLRHEIGYHPAPAALRERVRREVRGTLRAASRPAASSLPRWLPMAAGVVALAGAVWLATVPIAARRDAAAREVIVDHVRSLMVSHLTDVASTDQHTVKPWFAGRLDFSPPVTDFAVDGFPLVGGRLDLLEGRPVAALVYRRRQHVINAFVRPANADAALRMDSRDGWHVVSLARGGMAWSVVSDLNAAELAEFTRRLAASSAPAN